MKFSFSNLNPFKGASSPSLDLSRQAKRALRWVPISALSLGFVALMISAVQGEKSRYCTGLQISMDGTQDLFFIDPEMIRHHLGTMAADTFLGRALPEIDLSGIEEGLEKLPHVAKADAWIGNAGTLCINLEQRQPMLRVIHNQGVSYYIDIHGEKMPSTRTFTARVPVLSGWDGGDQESLAEIVILADKIRRDPFLSALVEQIHRSDIGEYELVPKVGDHIIRFGELREVDEKFEKLKTMYSEGLNYTGWDRYQFIDLRYQDLVYATKKQ